MASTSPVGPSDGAGGIEGGRAVPSRSEPTCATAGPLPGTRAVLRLITEGTHIDCRSCGEPIKFQGRARELHRMVIANVYADGRWSHIEHFHADHYDDRHGPADRTAIRGVVITPSKEPARAPAKWTPPKAPRPSRPLPELDVGDTDITDIGARRRRILELTASGMTGPAVAATLGIPLHMVYDARRYR